jgi:hypothetical protein
VVFCAGAPADQGGRQQQQQKGSDSSSGPGSSGPANQPRHNLRGRRSTPAGAKAQRRSSTSAAASEGADRSAADDRAADADHASSPAASSEAADGASRAATAGHAADVAPAGGADMAGAVQLAEALSEGRSQGEPPIAVGTLTSAQGGESSVCLMQFWLLRWVGCNCNSMYHNQVPTIPGRLCNMALSTCQPGAGACQARFSIYDMLRTQSLVPNAQLGRHLVCPAGADVAELQPASREPWAWGHVAVGGTFDRLHAGHRILLAATALAATQAVYIGVTGPALLQKKVELPICCRACLHTAQGSWATSAIWDPELVCFSVDVLMSEATSGSHSRALPRESACTVACRHSVEHRVMSTDVTCCWCAEAR